MFKVLIAALLLGFVGSPSANAAESPAKTAKQQVREYELAVSGEIDIGPEGRVLSHRLDDKVSPGVRELISKNIAQWQFEPVQVAGHPVIARTKLHMSITATPSSAETYQLKINNVWFGESFVAEKMNPPRYPQEALLAGLGAKVRLVLKLDADGNVVDAYARQVSLNKTGRENLAQVWRKRFASVSLAAAKKWRFKPGSMIHGEVLGSKVEVPVNFAISNSPNDSKGWKAYVPGPINESPWGDDELRLADNVNLNDGEAVAIDPRFKLLTDVAGTVL